MGLCVAFNCKEMGHYKFPKDRIQMRKWEKALRIVNFKSTSYSRLCGKHFKESDFETKSKYTGMPLTRKFLKKSAVPSIFSWNNASPGTSARDERMDKRNARRCLIPNTEQHTTDLSETQLECMPEPVLDCNELPIMQEVVISDEIQEDRILEPISPRSKSPVTVSTQTSTMIRIFATEEMLVDDKTIHYYTGLESYEKFRLVLSTLCPMANHLKYKGSQVITLSIEDQFLILLMKLRRNKNDFELSKYFGVSKTVVSNVFVTWLNFTYDLWSQIDIWPSRELVDYFMPSQFAKFPQTRIIIDGTEVPITKPTNPKAQQATFSNYKNRNTVKFLVGATPGGLISYCSEGYGGSTSDRQIVERSNLLNKCEYGDSIMADRGFNVQDLFANKNIAINIPAFLKGKSQLSGVTVKKDRLLASQRVHIERLIGLSKTFTILKSELNAYYVPLASRIFYVCIILCNFREGIMKRK